LIRIILLDQHVSFAVRDAILAIIPPVVNHAYQDICCNQQFAISATPLLKDAKFAHLHLFVLSVNKDIYFQLQLVLHVPPLSLDVCSAMEQLSAQVALIDIISQVQIAAQNVLTLLLDVTNAILHQFV
jgi:hypothetical protein